MTRCLGDHLWVRGAPPTASRLSGPHSADEAPERLESFVGAEVEMAPSGSSVAQKQTVSIALQSASDIARFWVQVLHMASVAMVAQIGSVGQL